MRILFLDDDQSRHDVVIRSKNGHFVDRVYNATDAIESLKVNEYDCVYLDHDLGGFDSENKMDCEEDGRTVARWIAANPERFKGVQFKVHSLNLSGATEMCLTLKQAGLYAYRKPFGWKDI